MTKPLSNEFTFFGAHLGNDVDIADRVPRFAMSCPFRGTLAQKIERLTDMADGFTITGLM